MMAVGPWLWILVVGVVVLVVVVALPRGGDGRDSARDVLDRRLAEGDLTPEEHAERRRALRERGAASSSRRWRGIGPVVVVVVVALLALLVWLVGGGGWGMSGARMGGGHMGGVAGGASGSSTDVVEGAREIRIEAGELYFDPDRVAIEAGETVNLRLVNTGQVFHDLTVPAADLVLEAQPGEEASGALELSEPGEYEFLCSVPGHEGGGMRGTIVVTGG